jgi:hypothetical protein
VGRIPRAEVDAVYLVIGLDSGRKREEKAKECEDKLHRLHDRGVEANRDETK